MFLYPTVYRNQSKDLSSPTYLRVALSVDVDNKANPAGGRLTGGVVQALLGRILPRLGLHAVSGEEMGTLVGMVVIRTATLIFNVFISNN